MSEQELEQGATAEVVAEQVEKTESVTETSEPKTLEDALWSDKSPEGETDIPEAVSEDEKKEQETKPEDVEDVSTHATLRVATPFWELLIEQDNVSTHATLRVAT